MRMNCMKSLEPDCTHGYHVADILGVEGLRRTACSRVEEQDRGVKALELATIGPPTELVTS